ncbi:alternative ribosome rescue aminoacyl-tRNA hydrolase ArfB [Formosa sp. S-31]|uniref:alternative ribosome rescue aminoacyl-tRNA hydrolase ArfB n=1 Tax=Formosa sp. S-31 TaxID=2790949 RepID=UPI003EBDC110
MNKDRLISEIQFKAVRSSGAGGQHVNKVASKVELSFNISGSAVLNAIQKERLIHKLKSRLTTDGMLLLQCGESRSQHKNKALVISRFFSILEEGLKVPKRRVATKIPKSVIKKRLKSKRILSEKKVFRRKPNLD